MPRGRLAALPRARAAALILGRMKLARLMEMPEGEFADLARRLESSPLFHQLSAAGVVAFSSSPAARLASRRFSGYGLRMSGSGLPELMDGRCDLARLMRFLGQERFAEWFLGDKPVSDEERARGCGITVEEARKLRDLMDRAFIRGEFEGPAPAAPEKVFSAVAGVQLNGERPILSFFHRDIWKRRYRVDQERLDTYLLTTSPAGAARARHLLSRLQIMEQRKTTLYRLLEEALRVQSEYLVSGDPSRRKPLSQKEMAGLLGRDPSVINRLISNKSVQMPWGLEAPLAVFFPSAKDVYREKFCALVEANPGLIDAELSRKMERVYGVRLSRRSIAQYRKELSLEGRRKRIAAPARSSPAQSI